MPLPKSRYFERTLKTEMRFYEIWIERDIQPPPYLSGWRLGVVQGGAKFGDKRGLLGGRALTGPRLEGSGAYNTRAEANAAFTRARASALRAGYAEVRSAARRTFAGYSRTGSPRRFGLKAPLAKP